MSKNHPFRKVEFNMSREAVQIVAFLLYGTVLEDVKALDAVVEAQDWLGRIGFMRKIDQWNGTHELAKLLADGNDLDDSLFHVVGHLLQNGNGLLGLMKDIDDAEKDAVKQIVEKLEKHIGPNIDSERVLLSIKSDDLARERADHDAGHTDTPTSDDEVDKAIEEALAKGSGVVHIHDADEIDLLPVDDQKKDFLRAVLPVANGKDVKVILEASEAEAFNAAVAKSKGEPTHLNS